jgi:acetyl esterase/lipase
VNAEYPPGLEALTAARPDAYHTVHYGPGVDQFGELWPAAGGPTPVPGGPSPAPVVVLVHGGYWRDRYRLDLMHAMAADLSGRGYAVWNVEYRRVGSPGGGWPGTFLDVAAALDALADLAGQHRLDLGRVSVVGHSAGGHLALWACGRHRLTESTALDADPRSGPEARHGTETQHGTEALSGTEAPPEEEALSPLFAPPRVAPALAVSLAGVCDLRMAAALRLSDDAVLGLLGGAPGEVPDRYDLACPTRLLPMGVPQVALHGTDDVDVPLELSTRYADLAGAECDLLVLPGVDHLALIDPASAAWPSVLRALARG